MGRLKTHSSVVFMGKSRINIIIQLTIIENQTSKLGTKKTLCFENSSMLKSGGKHQYLVTLWGIVYQM